MNTKTPPPKYLNVEISEEGLSEFHGNRRVIFIPKEKVKEIEIQFGSQAERPLLQIVAGILLVGLGVAGLDMIIRSGMRGVRWGLGFLFFGGLGAWLLYETFRKTHHLKVICHNETRKLVFRGNFQDADFSAFIEKAEAAGYNFKNCVNDRL